MGFVSRNNNAWRHGCFTCLTVHAKLIVTFMFVAMVVAVNAETILARETPESQLLFREDWKVSVAQTPITQDHVAAKNLVLTLHGPGKEWIKKSHHDQPADDPYYVWSGLCEKRWAFSLRKKNARLDLSTPGAKLRLRTKQAGDREVYLLIKTHGAQWYVSTQGVGASADWKEFELNIADLQWSRFDIATIIRGEDQAVVKLGVVEEIGLTDLQVGGKSKACSRIDWVEIWGGRARGAGR